MNPPDTRPGKRSDETWGQCLDRLYPVPPHMVCSYSYQWQNIIYDLERLHRRHRARIEELPYWQERAEHWRKQVRWPRAGDHDYNQRHLNCCEEIIVLLVKAKLGG